MHLYYLCRADFLEVLKRYPRDYELYCMLRDVITQGVDAQNEQLNCYTCQQPGHFATVCPVTHFVPDVLEIEEVPRRANIYEGESR